MKNRNGNLDTSVTIDAWDAHRTSNVSVEHLTNFLCSWSGVVVDWCLVCLDYFHVVFDVSCCVVLVLHEKQKW
jgi:hypothetical protein